MRVALTFDGPDCALVIEPGNEQEKALLAAFGMREELEAHSDVSFDDYNRERIKRVRIVVRPRLTDRVIARTADQG